MTPRSRWLITIVGLVLAGLGVTETTDGIVRYVSHVVDGHGWLSLWKPAFDPPPMNTYTYRPLTVALVKLELLLTGRSAMGMTLLHGLTIPWLGFAVHRFCRTHGMEAVATATALTTMALPSMLFAGWIPVESDGIGAAFICETGYFLQRYRQSPTRRHLGLLLLMAFGAATTKETSAAACFGYLLCAAWAYRGPVVKIWFGYSVTLTLLVLPLVLAKGQKPHDFHLQAQDFDLMGRLTALVQHNLGQLFYVVSSGGAALICLYPFRKAPRLFAGLMVVAALALLAVPPMRVYNHYESVIVDQIVVVMLSMGPALLALLWMAFRKPPEDQPHLGVLAGTPVFLLLVLIVAPMVALQSRPDVSARLYAPAVPMLAALSWTSLLLAVRATPRWVRLAGWIVAGSYALFPPTQALNGVTQMRARMEVERAAKGDLATRLKAPGIICPFIIAVNRDHELAAEELTELGVDWQTCNQLFVPNRVHLDPGDSDYEEWRVQGHRYSLLAASAGGLAEALLDGRAPEKTCAYLYVQGPKSMMETRDFKRFSGDFEWAYGRLPEFDQEVYEQQVEIQFREQTGYEKLFRRAGGGELAYESPFFMFPLNPNELVGRLRLGLPVIESYAYEARILYFETCSTD